jgi:hypothetical protein
MSPLLRRIVGWSCIAVGKVGSLVLLWQLVVVAEPGAAAVGPMPLLVLFGMSAGAVVVGICVLMQDNEHHHQEDMA